MTEAARWLHPLTYPKGYKDLLVHLDDSKGCRKRVDAAVRLARQHGAHLTGVYPIVKISLLHYIRRHIPRDVQATMDAEAQRQAETALEGLSGGCTAWRLRLRDEN